jgi:hypothetical protein
MKCRSLVCGRPTGRWFTLDARQVITQGTHLRTVSHLGLRCDSRRT